MGYRLNRLVEPIFIAVSKPLLTEFGIHHRLESCDHHCINFTRPLFYSNVMVFTKMYVNMPGPVKDCVPSCAALTPSVTSLLSPRVERARTLCLRHQPPSPKKTSNSTTLILSRQKNKMQRTKTKVEMINQVLALGCPELKKT